MYTIYTGMLLESGFLHIFPVGNKQKLNFYLFIYLFLRCLRSPKFHMKYRCGMCTVLETFPVHTIFYMETFLVL